MVTPASHRLARAQQRADRGERQRLVAERAHRIGLRAQAEMHVAVDEPGQERVAGEIHAVAARRPAPSSTTAAMRPPSTTTARPRTGSAPVPSISASRSARAASCMGPRQTLSRGSSVSRSPSPKRLMPSTVTRMARPGNVASHHAVER